MVVSTILLTGCPGGENGSILTIPGFQSPSKKATPTPAPGPSTPVSTKTPTPGPNPSSGNTPSPGPSSLYPTPVPPPFGSVTIDLGGQHNAWGVSEPMSTLRAGLIAWVRNGKIYAADGDGYSTIEERNGDSWSAKQYSLECRYFSAVALIGGKVYQASGFDGDGYYPRVLEYDPQNGKLDPKAELPTVPGVRDPVGGGDVQGRSHAGSGVLQFGGSDQLCLAGGMAGGKVLDQFISYLPGNPSWDILPKLPAPRTAMGAATLNNRLYLFGGYASSGQPLASMVLYDPSLGQWSSTTPNGAALPSLKKARHSLMGIALNGKIYAIGGADGANKVLREVEEYDPTTNTWRNLSSIPTARALGAVVALDNKIFALGGFDDGGRPLRTVEVFYP